MKIYTKGGDQGETGLWGGERVPKDHLRIRTYGALDELNAVLGIVLCDQKTAKPLRERLERIQGELFQLGSELATPRGQRIQIALVDEAKVTQLEKEIDEMETQLKPLKNFILPGGVQAAAFLHLARTVSRRVERELMPLHRAEPVRPVVLQYINRLSDYLFVCARFSNFLAKSSETSWVAPRQS